VHTPTPIRSNSMWMHLLAIPVFYGVNIGTNNMSLEFTTLGTNVMVRSFTPIFGVVFAYFIERKRVVWKIKVCLVVLMAGISMGIAGDPDYNFKGVLLCVVSTVGGALQIAFMALAMDSSQRLHPLDILLYTSIPGSILLAPFVYMSGEFDDLWRTINKDSLQWVSMLIVVGGVIAFLYNLITMLFIRFTSAVYSEVAGSFKTVPIVVSSFLFFGQKVTTLSLSGMALACLAFGCHSYLQFMGKTEFSLDYVDDEAVPAKIANPTMANTKSLLDPKNKTINSPFDVGSENENERDSFWSFWLHSPNNLSSKSPEQS